MTQDRDALLYLCHNILCPPGEYRGPSLVYKQAAEILARALKAHLSAPVGVKNPSFQTAFVSADDINLAAHLLEALTLEDGLTTSQRDSRSKIFKAFEYLYRIYPFGVRRMTEYTAFPRAIEGFRVRICLNLRRRFSAGSSIWRHWQPK